MEAEEGGGGILSGEGIGREAAEGDEDVAECFCGIEVVVEGIPCCGEGAGSGAGEVGLRRGGEAVCRINLRRRRRKAGA